MRRQVTDWRDPGRVYVAPGLPYTADAHTRITLFGNAASLCDYSTELLVIWPGEQGELTRCSA